MLLTDIVTPQRIVAPMTARTKAEAITELVDVLAAAGDLTDRDKALAAVLEREHTRTTGIGNGLAIPHGKATCVKKLVMAIGRCAPPIPFDSVDGKPVNLVLLLVSPLDQTGPHIQALAHIMRLLSVDAFRNKLANAPSPDELYKLIQTQEQQDAAGP